MNKELAQYILANHGYNYALSDVEDACNYLDHPELTEEDSHNYHKWSEPYPRRCYCSVIGYTDRGKFYANEMSEEHFKTMKNMFPWFENKFGQPYERKAEDL